MSDPVVPPRVMPEAAGPVVPPFNPKVTPEIVLDALHKAVSGDTRLSLHSPPVKHLTHILNFIRWKVWAGPRRDSPGREQIEKVTWERWAIHGSGVINYHQELWPAAEQGYAVPTGHMRWDNMDVAVLQAPQNELEGLRKLQTTKPITLKEENAAREREKRISELEREIPRHERVITAASVRKRALEIGWPILSMCKISGWHDFAAELQAIFCDELPGQGPEAADRFMVAVLPAVTDETVRVGTIKGHVNRVARQSRDTD
jgi:hypothetical protein